MYDDPSLDSTSPDLPEEPTQIGPYKILRTLGEGGMGVVFEAEQTEPIHRRVALKLIKLGMDTKQVVARFEGERQALAVMDHPNIAKVFDGGSTETGRPYFVMELVKGTPLTDYCDTHKLSTERRLRLFIQICAAIQHAHQKGVIHRDLKPSNVLITVQEEVAFPKVIDFGIAKAVGHDLTERIVVTQMGQLMGTPEYMSPEQAEMSGLDVDTRTDIYALGVMLYELLVGALPYDLKGVSQIAMRSTIREREAHPPSSRLTTLSHDQQETVARYRRTDPQRLKKALRGDLDWVVMRAMEKDRTLRYGTANGLAMELDRYLKHEPVLARPPSAAYRMRKFARRNRAWVAAAAVMVLAVSGGTLATTVGMVRASRAEAQASEEAATSEKVSEFLVKLFEVADPNEARGNSITAREILDKGVNDIRSGLDDQPVVQARLMHVMGRVYSSLGLYGPAEGLLDDAVALGREHFGPNAPGVAFALQDLAFTYGQLGKLERANRASEEALAIALETFGPDTPEAARGHQGLGVALRMQGEYDGARTHLERSLEINERALGPDDFATAESLRQLAWLHVKLEEREVAKTYYERGIPIAERELGDDHPKLASFVADFGALLADMGDYDGAREQQLRALAIRERALGPDHLLVGWSLNNLGGLDWVTGDLAAARAYYERALRVYEQALGPDASQLGIPLGNLGLLLQSMGEYAESVEYYRRALSVLERALGPSHIELAGTLNNFGWLLRTIGHYAAAERYLERALDIRQRVVGDDHTSLILPLSNLIYASRDRGDYERARDYAQRVLSITESQRGSDSVAVGGALRDLGEALALSGERDAAHEILERAARTDPANEWVGVERARLHRSRGEDATADSLFARWLDTRRNAEGRESKAYAYSEVRYWALTGDRGRAIRDLRALVEDGYSDPFPLRDPYLLSLHGDAAFEAVVGVLKKQAGIDQITVPLG